MRKSTVFGFDFGNKRIGLAVGQTVTKTASPLVQLNNHSEPDWRTLDKLVNEWGPSRFIVGLPLHMDDSASHQSLRARAFAEQLTQRYSIETSFIDERLTTREALERLQEQGITRPTKNEINNLSAQIILENWFNQEFPPEITESTNSFIN